jgi:Flp pilus assembly protein TadD
MTNRSPESPSHPLPPELTSLADELAESVHDAWAAQRVREGWKYGPRRDDQAKTHPDLVAWAELSDTEREYDRISARETLRFIRARGFEVVPRPSAAPPAPRDATAARTAIAEARGASRLVTLWISRDEKTWASDRDLHLLLARRLIDAGEAFIAQEVLRAARLTGPEDHGLRYLEGLALARSGATRAAHAVAKALAAEVDGTAAPLFEDIHGLLGRTAKETALAAATGRERSEWLSRASAAYEHAFDTMGGSYSGINAAVVRFLSGDKDGARRLATRAEQAARNEPESHWTHATLGDASLLNGDLESARSHYSRAAAIGGVNWGDLASTRRQARLICTATDVDADWIDEALPVPAVIVFAGQRATGGDREFSGAALDRVKSALRERLIELRVGIGFSGAAAGGDILFQEVLRDPALDAETFVVLPYRANEFVETSVAPAGADWVSRFEDVLAAAAAPSVATGERSVDDALLVEYSHRLLLGYAALRAATLDTRVVPLILWDGRADDPDGPAGAAATWRVAGHEVEVIDLAAITGIE